MLSHRWIVRAHLRLHFAGPPPSAPHNLPALSVTCLLPYLTIALSHCPDQRSRSYRDPVGSLPTIALSPLAATLIDLPVSVANKRLTVWAKPFRCNTYKKQGEGTKLLFTRNPTKASCRVCILECLEGSTYLSPAQSRGRKRGIFLFVTSLHPCPVASFLAQLSTRYIVIPLISLG